MPPPNEPALEKLTLEIGRLRQMILALAARQTMIQAADEAMLCLLVEDAARNTGRPIAEVRREFEALVRLNRERILRELEESKAFQSHSE